MRTGVLSDANARHHEPLPFKANARHFDVPHLEKTERSAKRKGERSVTRPRAPLLAHQQLAQFMEPLNQRPHIEAFGRQMSRALHPEPVPTFQTIVDQFQSAFPRWSGLPMETQFFLGKIGADPHDRPMPQNLVTDKKIYHSRVASFTPSKALERFFKARGDDRERNAELMEAYRQSVQHIVKDEDEDAVGTPISPAPPPPPPPPPITEAEEERFRQQRRVRERYRDRSPSQSRGTPSRLTSERESSVKKESPLKRFRERFLRRSSSAEREASPKKTPLRFLM